MDAVGVVAHLGTQLRAVMGLDAVPGQFERRADVVRGGRQGGLQRSTWDPHGGQVHTVEAGGPLEQRVVTAGAYVSQDLPHHRDGFATVDNRSGQAAAQFGHPAEIESVEHGGQGSVRVGRGRYGLAGAGARKSAVSLRADLASLQSTLDQMLQRVDEAGNEVRGTTRDDLLGDLYEIERHLQAASRRLRRATDSLPGDS